MCETVKQYLKRTQPKSTRELNRFAAYHVQKLARTFKTRRLKSVIPTAKRAVALTRELTNAGFKKIRISRNRGQRLNIWTVKMLAGPTVDDPTNETIRVAVQRAIQAVGYSIEEGNITGVATRQRRVWAGFIVTAMR